MRWLCWEERQTQQSRERVTLLLGQEQRQGMVREAVVEVWCPSTAPPIYRDCRRCRPRAAAPTLAAAFAMYHQQLGL